MKAGWYIEYFTASYTFGIRAEVSIGRVSLFSEMWTESMNFTQGIILQISCGDMDCPKMLQLILVEEDSSEYFIT